MSVWWQALVENAKTVELACGSYPVRRTARRDLVQVDFSFEDEELRGL